MFSLMYRFLCFVVVNFSRIFSFKNHTLECLDLIFIARDFGEIISLILISISGKRIFLHNYTFIKYKQNPKHKSTCSYFPYSCGRYQSDIRIRQARIARRGRRPYRAGSARRRTTVRTFSRPATAAAARPAGHRRPGIFGNFVRDAFW